MDTQLPTDRPQFMPPSSLARALDPRVPSNLMILIFAPLVAVVIAVIHLLNGTPLLETAINAAGAGAFTGLAWVIGRELDPDHNLTAYVAAVLMAAALFVVEFPSLLSLIVIMMALRVLNRSTGLRPRRTDLLALIVLTGIAVALDGSWLIGMVATLALVVNAFLPDADRERSLLGALATGLITVVVTIFAGAVSPLVAQPDMNVMLLALGVSAAYLVIVLRAPQPRAVGDMTGEPLHRDRVLAGQLLALTAAVAFLLWSGTTGVIALLPLWTAMLGILTRSIARHVGFVVSAP